MHPKQIFRVVLASPSDTETERGKVARVVDVLNGMLRGADLPVLIELWRWETDAYPGLHLEGPQGQIDDSLRIEDADALIGVFCQRLGTPVLNDASGTVHEIRCAINVWNAKGTPQVMIYFKEATGPILDQDQFQKLQTFRADLISQPVPKNNPLVWSYSELDLFEREVQFHLWKLTFAAANAIVAKSSPMPIHFSLVTKKVCVRFEGLSELLGDITLVCTGGGIEGRWPFYFDVFLYLNTAITSRGNGVGVPTRTDVVLFEGAGPMISNAVWGMALSINCLLFKGVKIDRLRPKEIRQFHISGLHANANLLGVGADEPPGITTAVTVTGAPVENDRQIVAIVKRGLEFELRSWDSSQKMEQGIALPQEADISLGRIATLRFNEGYAGAFKQRLQAVGLHNSPVTFTPSEETDSVQVFLSESPLLTLAFSGKEKQLTHAALANQGAGLTAVFNSVPFGVRLFISVAAESSGTSMDARILDDESSTINAADIDFEGIQIRELAIRDGAASVSWEVTRANIGSAPGHLDFAVIATYHSDPLRNLPALGTVTVNGSFGPTSTIGISSPASPIPRFADTSSAATLLTILRARV